MNLIINALRTYLVCLFGLLLVPLSTFSQIKEINDLKIPQAILNTYPFIESNFYFIKCPDSTGMEGYFVLTLNKKKLNEFIGVEIDKYAQEQFRKYHLFESSCTVGWNNCGSKHSDFDRFDQTKVFGSSTLIGNSFIRTPTSISMKARKTNTYRTRVFDSGWTCRRERDRSIESLLNVGLVANMSFAYNDNRFRFDIKTTAVGNANILFDGCSFLLAGSPYHRKRSESIGGNTLLSIDLNRFGTEEQGLLRVFLENTKRVNITEDNSNYYVYCIRTKV